MANAAARARVEWMWKSNADPWNPSQKEEWSSYSDVETAIIEDAYKKNLSEVLIDDYHINVKRCLQISNSNPDNQRPIRRIAGGRSSQPRLREERFMPNPIHPAMPFAEQRFLLGFYGELFKLFNVSSTEDLSEPSKRQEVIKKAAEGILIEGKLVGKQKEAEWMAQQLLDVKNGTEQQVWECCLHLYTMESFLYKKMNEYMRLCGDSSQTSLWKTKMATFAPFAYLLQSYSYKTDGKKMYVYRGANLPDNLIQQYRENIGAYLTFPAFTSTSRNRSKAEQFGNVLFMVHVRSSDGTDVASLSDYPDEEEMLLTADFAFYIRSCTLDRAKNKWVINISAWNDD